MTPPLAASYDFCRTTAAAQARNFYFGIRVLPKPKRDALCAVYAFMRRTDDYSDDDEVVDKSASLARWRATVAAALNHDPSAYERAEQAGESDVLLPAFLDAVERYRIPHSYFHELIDGMEMDLALNTYETFEDLYRYCYRVASIVGLVCIHVFGFSEARAKQLAEWNGIAFQLTNILRDLREDAERSRVYLPLEDLHRFGFADAETFVREGIAHGPAERRFVELMKFECDRAHEYYRKAAPLLDLIEPDSRAALWAMTTIYRTLLERIAASGYEVVTRRVSVPKPRKFAVLATAWLRGPRCPPLPG